MLGLQRNMQDVSLLRFRRWYYLDRIFDVQKVSIEAMPRHEECERINGSIDLLVRGK